MEIKMDPLQRQMLDDAFDAYAMLSNGAIVSLMHVQGNTTRWSPAGVELFGLSGEYIENGSMDWGDYVHPEDKKRYMEAMTPLVSGEKQNYDLTYRVRTKSGEYGNFRALGSVIRNDAGEPSLIGGVLINQGLTENTDPVTVLPNINTYREDMAKLLNEGKNVLSLQVGISKFSTINETYGYSYGNKILQEVAWMIQDIVKERGRVYRTLGATFSVISDDISRDRMAAIYDNIRYRMQRGVELGGIKNTLAANGGLISSNGFEGDASTVVSCLSYAYEESKKRFHGDLVDFNGTVKYDGTKSLDRISRIRESAANGCKGFSLEYIPVIDAATGNMNGAEADIYWESETDGRVDSPEFLPVLERDFIFEEIGDFIFEKGLSDGVRFLEKKPDFLLCLNVYRIQLESNYFIDNLTYYLEETGFPPEMLSIKFDSDCRFIRQGHMKEIIDRLHKMKILVIIGDFGSGTDSIGFLKSEPVDAVSIDKQFTSDITDNKALNTLNYLSKIANDYVKHINVKGVNTAKLMEIIKDFSVSTMQGEFFSKPLSFDEVMEKYLT